MGLKNEPKFEDIASIVYMNEFDQYVKHKLKVKYYIRYADDFVILSKDKEWLVKILADMSEYLLINLKLSMHPDKVFIKTCASGVDFLGWVHFPHHRILRGSTRKRALRNISKGANESALQSYLGMMKHGDAYRSSVELRNIGFLNL